MYCLCGTDRDRDGEEVTVQHLFITLERWDMPPPSPKSHFPTHAGRVVEGEFWGPDTPPARAPHSGKGPPRSRGPRLFM